MRRSGVSKCGLCTACIVPNIYRVPLDYFNLSAGFITLPLAKYPAKKGVERLGTIFMNPGGPGGSGVGYIYSTAESLSVIVEGRYDIVRILCVERAELIRRPYYPHLGVVGPSRSKRN